MRPANESEMCSEEDAKFEVYADARELDTLAAMSADAITPRLTNLRMKREQLRIKSN